MLTNYSKKCCKKARDDFKIELLLDIEKMERRGEPLIVIVHSIKRTLTPIKKLKCIYCDNIVGEENQCCEDCETTASMYAN